MTELNFGCVTLVNDNSLVDIKKQESDSWNLISLDPPIDIEFNINNLQKWIDQSERILSEGGN